MKIYVAGKFEKKDIILNIYQKVREMGHLVSYDWTTHKDIEPYSENQDTARQYSENELAGIGDCDLFIYLADDKGTTLPMEFGAALMRKKLTGKPEIFAVGEHNARSPWFFNRLVKRVGSVDEVLEEMSHAK